MYNLPKIELHLHLDGSLNINDVRNKYGLTEEEANNKMVADNKCKNLNDYLTKFDYPISIMQTKEELSSSIKGLLNTLKNQNVLYAEIRFAPQLHTKKGLTQTEVVETLIKAKNEVNIKSNLILCFMRSDDNSLNYETLEVAKKFIGKGVCAVDLAGAEGIYKTSSFEELFNKVKEYNIPFTIHAGEADGVSSINSAIDFGAKRIGHGVRCIEDDETIKRIIKEDITLEMCPTSNIQTCVANDYSKLPIKKLFKRGVKVTINTDNMTVSNTTLEKEYNYLNKHLGFTRDDIIQMNINSIYASFLSLEEKEKLFEEYKSLLNPPKVIPALFVFLITLLISIAVTEDSGVPIEIKSIALCIFVPLTLIPLFILRKNLKKTIRSIDFKQIGNYIYDYMVIKHGTLNYGSLFAGLITTFGFTFGITLSLIKDGTQGMTAIYILCYVIFIPTFIYSLLNIRHLIKEKINITLSEILCSIFFIFLAILIFGAGIYLNFFAGKIPFFGENTILNFFKFVICFGLFVFIYEIISTIIRVIKIYKENK